MEYRWLSQALRWIGAGSAAATAIGAFCSGIVQMGSGIFGGLLIILGGLVAAVITFVFLYSFAALLDHAIAINENLEICIDLLDEQKALLKPEEPEDPSEYGYRSDAAAAKPGKKEFLGSETLIEYSSDQTVVVCPKCGAKKTIKAADIERQGFVCDECGAEIGIVRK